MEPRLLPVLRRGPEWGKVTTYPGLHSLWPVEQALPGEPHHWRSFNQRLKGGDEKDLKGCGKQASPPAGRNRDQQLGSGEHKKPRKDGREDLSQVRR